MTSALAVIPSIGLSPYLPALVDVLRDADVQTLVVTNHPLQAFPGHVADTGADRMMWRPGWRGLYRQWNLGLGYGALLGVPTLVLNDDIVLTPQAVRQMVDKLREGGWALLGFDYTGEVRSTPQARAVQGTWRRGGIGGFAFGANPRRCARVDRRFRWWAGDDDLVYATLARGESVGLLYGCRVEHPQPSLSANQSGGLLPDGWADNDARLLWDKWGERW